MEADGQNVAGLDAVARRLLAHAIDADMAGLDQRGSRGAGLHHPRMPQPFIETLALPATPPKAFSSEVGTGSPEENASKQTNYRSLRLAVSCSLSAASLA